VNQTKGHRKKQLERTRTTIENRQLPAEKTDGRDLPRNEAERRALVENRIQEAMKSGAFDDLRGKGKPLDLNSNPYLEPGQELAFGLLKNQGFAPEWIERDKEIRRELAAARDELRTAWRHRQANPVHESVWQVAVARFEVQFNKLNRKISDFNLIVPIVSKQRARLRLADELRRLQEEEE
jgi:DnaJ family protein C protein 28